MQRHSLPKSLGRPALHLLLALAFAVAFFWPIFAMTHANQTFHFLYGSWFFSLVVLFVVSRVAAHTSDDAAQSENESESESSLERPEEMY